MFRKILLFAMCISVYSSSIAQIDRPIDGYGVNTDNPEWGAAAVPFMRITTMNFGDGFSSPGGTDRPNPRYISFMLGQQEAFMPNEKGLSDFIWGWGQFVDHDINLNEDHQ